jgi:gluconolactonase
MQVKVFARGFTFPEAPAFDRQGNLFVGNMRPPKLGIMHKVTPQGEVSEFVNTGGAVNGAAFHPSGDMYVADAQLGILCITTEASVHVFASEYEGEHFGGPNDLVFDSQGVLYFTDPVRNPMPDPCISPVFKVHPSGRVELFAEDFAFPNGIGLSPDESTVYIAESRADRIAQVSINPDGTAGKRDILVQFAKDEHPDSMAMDEKGNVLAAMLGKGVIAVVSPGGELLEEVPAGGSRPSNVCFGGPEFKTLYITETETNSVTTVEYSHRGMRLYGDR